MHQKIMHQTLKKLVAVLCVLALAMTVIPPVPAKAAAVPKYAKTYASIYENVSSNGKYTYTLKNLTKGQTVKWSLTGAGKSYVKLDYASKKATSTSMKNVITVNTAGKMAAKDQKVTVVAKVYSKAGKLQYTVKTSAKIKVRPKTLKMVTPKEVKDSMHLGESYNFGYTISPVNSTSTNAWAVTDEAGNDCSSYMSSTGVFRPLKTGIYKIAIQAKIDGKLIKQDYVYVDVIDHMVSAEQLSVNKIRLAYSGDIRSSLQLDDITVQNAAGAPIVPKSIEFSADGKKADVTMYSNFKDGASYTISDGKSVHVMNASVGVPVKLEVLTAMVTVNKETNIEYALYDANGIDVTAAYEGNLIYTPEIINGYITKDNKLFMSTVGSTGTVTVQFTNKADSNNVVTGVGVVTCVAATTSVNTNFTLMANGELPNYTAPKYEDNRKASIGTSYVAHFRALDTDKSEIRYESVRFQSSDPDTLIITADGRVTPIKSGTVKILVTALYAGETYTYNYEITIAEAPYLKQVNFSESTVSISNVYNTEYKKYVNVTAVDQYDQAYPLTNEIATIVDKSVIKANLVTYNAAANQLEIKAAAAAPMSYQYEITFAVGAQKVTQNLNVDVYAIPNSGTVTYVAEIDKSNIDMALTTDVAGSMYANVRLAQYRNGLFTNYVTFTKANIKQGSNYYGTDLTLGGKTTEQSLTAANKLTIKAMDITGNVCKKAALGTYTIEMQYYSSEEKVFKTATVSLELTDSQAAKTEVRLVRTTGSVHCDRAMDLVKNCYTIENGTMVDCVVTGTAVPGSALVINAGDQININSINVSNSYTIAGGIVVVMNSTVYVGKTLTNI